LRGGDDVVVAVVGGGVERGVEEEGEGEEDVVIDAFRMVVVCERRGRLRFRYLWTVEGRGRDIGRRKGRGSVDAIVEVRSRGIDGALWTGNLFIDTCSLES